MDRPLKETPRSFVTHAKSADLNQSMNEASMAMINWLAANKNMTRHDAYGLASVSMDCRIGAVSSAEKNVHCLLPKSLWNMPK
jgi:acetamidase/formamidase